MQVHSRVVSRNDYDRKRVDLRSKSRPRYKQCLKAGIRRLFVWLVGRFLNVLVNY